MEEIFTRNGGRWVGCMSEAGVSKTCFKRLLFTFIGAFGPIISW
jgi:hypothetical protein